MVSLSDSTNKSLDCPPPSCGPGWEQKWTASGELYYVNHSTRTTSWERPLGSSVVVSPPVAVPVADRVETALPPGKRPLFRQCITSWFIRYEKTRIVVSNGAPAFIPPLRTDKGRILGIKYYYLEFMKSNAALFLQQGGTRK